MSRFWPASDRKFVWRASLICVMAAVLGAQSPQEASVAAQRESILRQQQSVLESWGESANRPAAVRSQAAPALHHPSSQPAPLSRQPAAGASVSLQLASVHRQVEALARQQQALAGSPAKGPLPPLDPAEPQDRSAEMSHDGQAALHASLSSQLASAALQPRLAWPEPSFPASVFVCDPMPLAALDPIFDRAARSFGVESSLLRAVARKESAFQPCAVSRAGAMGLMQLMPETALSLGVTDPFDPEQNIFGGARFLRLLLDRYGNDLTLALSAYNAGPARVERSGGVPRIPETMDYVSTILHWLARTPPE